jgi:hypothetical protein
VALNRHGAKANLKQHFYGGVQGFEYARTAARQFQQGVQSMFAG